MRILGVAALSIFAVFCNAGILPAVFKNASGTLAVRVQREPGVPKELRERVGEWADRYASSLPSYAAEETLRQVRWEKGKRPGATRRIVADYFLLRMPEGDRVELRDVVSVDAKQFQDAAKRSEKSEKLAQARTRSEIFALIDSAEKHYLFPEHFTRLNLLVTRLAARHQDKMRLFFAPDTSDPPSEYVLLGYRQYAGEGLIDVDGKPVYPAGRAWVEPDDGHVERIEEEFEYKGKRYAMAVDFVREETLAAWVPSEITVRIFEKGRLQFESVYSYENYRPVPSADRNPQ